MGTFRDLSNMVFGRLKVLSVEDKTPEGKYKWMCKCECGSYKIVIGANLVNGITTSCGCFHKEDLLSRITKHGQAKSKKLTPEFICWTQMKERCLNKNKPHYENYGGRGITICERWLGDNGFNNFFIDMGKRPSPKHSLDRFPDNNGNYEPNNCRWATTNEQARNKRNNIFIKFNNKSQTIADWAKELGVYHGSITQMLKTKPFSEVYHYYNKKQLAHHVI